MSDDSSCSDKCRDCGSSWSCFVQWDQVLTGYLAVCSSSTSKWGRLRPLMRLLEYSGHGVPWIIVPVALVLTLHQIELQQKFINLLIALLVDIGVCATLKVMAQRSRPAHNGSDQLTISVDKYSMPSGHAMRAVMCACFIINTFNCSQKVAGSLILWAAAVSASRIMLGRHHVTDVVLGIIVGMLEYWLMNAFNIWISVDTAAQMIQPIQEELHL